MNFREHRFWREVWPRLTGLGRVTTYDVRGHGFSRAAPLATSPDQLADEAANLRRCWPVSVRVGQSERGTAAGCATSREFTLSGPTAVTARLPPGAARRRPGVSGRIPLPPGA
jgi:hypothetical protein